jgi:ribonucleoside-diphosphate reductase alpha chain
MEKTIPVVVDETIATSKLKRPLEETVPDPFERVGPWSRRDVRIVDGKGEVVFAQANVEAPASWSDRAVTVVASKYFRGHVGRTGREDSVRGLIERVVDAIADWGHADGYFDCPRSRDLFRGELAYLLASQALSFNSPVWFNVGVDERPQCSACFISSVEDSMESIMEFARTEARIFKNGGGSGANLSRLRASDELLSGGGVASGPISFMRGFDSFAGAIKSGGKTRRAAKMVALDVDHPDILEFVRSKRVEEEKARVLAAAGYAPSVDAPATYFSNANHSVRVTDDFMERVERDEDWETIGRTTGCVATEIPARELFREIAEAAHACGCPGLQFDTTVNAWHTSPGGGRINASNPCAEFVFLDDSACNLASLNLRRFQLPNGRLDVERFEAAVDVAVTAMEILVDRARYPTEAIERNSHRYRPLGLGYANLGAFLMVRGLAYDSDEARAVAAAVTALMTGRAYRRSAELAEIRGTFEAYEENRASMLGVIRRHLDETGELRFAVDETGPACRAWKDALALGESLGYRNAQVTLLAPTGTVAFMMDCDTTGIEPALALRSEKKLVGGGTVEIVVGVVEDALRALGYSQNEVDDVLETIDEEGTVFGSPLRGEHVAIFDCALPDAVGRSISVDGHLGMMAAVQPFLSGAISKTVNLSAEATVEDVEEVYTKAWRLGLKAVALYRDGSKAVQPLEAKNGNGKKAALERATDGGRLVELAVGGVTSTRVKLPNEARTVRHKFEIGGGELEGYVHVGLYDDGRVGEIFVRAAKEGAALSGLLDAFATAVSIGLQYGVPFEVFTKKFARWRFEPSGVSGDRRIGYASSIVDYLARWLDVRFPGGRDAQPAEVAELARRRAPTAEYSALPRRSDAPFCADCGAQLRPNGSCHVCPVCGTTTGCS